MPSVANSDVVVGMDVSKNTIVAGVLTGGDGLPVVESLSADEASVRRFFQRFDHLARVSACYEAGPTGYDLHRLLSSMGVRCVVVAPSLIPKGPGDRVKTDKRDARRLAVLHEAGLLTPIRVPTPREEAVRDLCRTRADLVGDVTQAKNRLFAFLLRHGRVWRDGRQWTMKHRHWVAAQSFDDPALTATLGYYRANLETRENMLHAIEADLAVWFDREPFGAQVSRLAAYRGFTHQGALMLAAEVCDWRRFASARHFMGFVGLTPSEYSSGDTTRRGRITKAGNAHLRAQLNEAAWAYSHLPHVGPGIATRQQGLPPEVIARSWKAQQRLCRRYRHLAERKSNKNIVITAVARELAGFVWAEMTAD
jgi:transposase